MGKNLTKRQREILDFTNDFIKEKGYAPSMREIGDHFGLSSPATIHVHIKNLKEKGFLKTSLNEARSMELIPAQVKWTQAIELPLAGLITAGEPIEAVEQKETIAVPANFVKDDANSYVLKVKGESMIDEGIFDGDWVIIEQRSYARNGEIVVALVDKNEATLKYIEQYPNETVLIPANKTMEPMRYNPGQVEIQGVLVGQMRSYLH